MRRPIRRAAVLIGLFVFAGCNQGSQVQNGNDPPIPTAEALGKPPSAEADGSDFLVRFETTAGDFVIQVHPSWAPLGAMRFRELVESGFYDGCRFFRVLAQPPFMVQFGINGDPAVQARWRKQPIADEPATQPNRRGYVTYAHGGPETRSTQVFVNYADNRHLDDSTFPPFGEVIEGMSAVEAINSEYRERPDQGRVQYEGNAYLNAEFPNLDYIKKATIIASDAAPPGQKGPAGGGQP